MLYDSVTIQVNSVMYISGILLESLDYCKEFTAIYKTLLGNTAEIRYESIKNMPNACTSKNVQITMNSHLFLTVCGIFSKQVKKVPHSAWMSVPK